MSFNSRKNLQTVSLFWAVSWALALSSDCKRFLEGPAMYWKQEKGSNWPASENSVFTFLQVFWNFVWPFLVSLGREFDWRGLHMYPWMRISHNKELLTITMKFWISSLTPLKNLPFLFKIWISCLKWTVHEIGRRIMMYQSHSSHKISLN